MGMTTRATSKANKPAFVRSKSKRKKAASSSTRAKTRNRKVQKVSIKKYVRGSFRKRFEARKKLLKKKPKSS